MPISFHCETCRRSICVPDGSEGKKTRCPECYSIVQVPFSGNTPLLKVPDEPQFATPEEQADPLGIVGKNESRWDQPAPEETLSNPFASTVSRSAPTPLPQSIQDQDLAARHQTTVTNLATILMAMGSIFLVAMLLNLFFQIASSVDQPAPDMEAIVELVITIIFAFIQLATIMALNEARMMRRYGTACVGMILAIIPLFNPAACLVFPLGLAIWGLVLILRSDVRAAFESQQRYTPD